MDEVFYVLEGTWEFEIDQKKTIAPPGTTIHLPRGVVHGFKNVGQSRGRLVDYQFPGGFEKFFEEAGTEALDNQNAPQLPPPDMAKLLALFNKHGMDLPQ
jgi:hypothetical protein